MPVYSLAAAHGNDFAGSGGHVKVTAALMFYYSIGAVVGPLASSFAMERFGLPAIFVYSALVYAGLAIFTVLRMRTRAAPNPSQRSRFTALLRTSPVFAWLAQKPAPRHGRGDGPRA
jgi:MFS family permease